MASTGSVQSLQTERFIIIHDRSRQWAGKLGERLEALADRFDEEMAAWDSGLIESPNDGRLEWLCFGVPPAEGESVRLNARYDTRLHRVILKWNADEPLRQSSAAEAAFEAVALPADERDDDDLCMLCVSHEMAHQLSFDSKLLTRGIMYPLWLVEGLATNLERPDGGMKFLGPNILRQLRLLALEAEDRLLPLGCLAAVTSMSNLTREERIDFYAQAWGFFRFLAQERKEDLTRYFQTLGALQFGPRTEDQLRSELVASFGSFDELDRAWQRWLSALFPRPEPSPAKSRALPVDTQPQHLVPNPVLN